MNPCAFHQTILDNKSVFFPRCDVELEGSTLKVQPIGSLIELRAKHESSFRGSSVLVHVDMGRLAFFKGRYSAENGIDEFFMAVTTKYVYSQAMFDTLTRLDAYQFKDVVHPDTPNEIVEFTADACRRFYAPIRCRGTQLTKQFKNASTKRTTVKGDPLVDETQISFGPGESEMFGRLFYNPGVRKFQASFRLPPIYGSSYKSKIDTGRTVNVPMQSEWRHTVHDACQEVATKAISHANNCHTALSLLLGTLTHIRSQ